MKVIPALLLIILTQSAVFRAAESPKAPEKDLLSGLSFRCAGPALMSGRISDIAIHPRRPAIRYIAAGSGGVWKTMNAGTTWTPIFDHQGSYSIGCLAIDSQNPETIYVGTGENVSGRHVGIGDGLYRSRNGGQTWENIGLKDSQHIGRIIVHPHRPDTLFVACEGPLWSPGGERGLYKTVDGGKTWSACLYISKDTGVTDVVINPANPDILIAAAYQRRRSVAAFIAGGPESGLYKTSDGGQTWRKLSEGLPTDGDIGKTGLAVSPQNPDVLYATIEANNDRQGFYRSENGGESWEKRNSYISRGTGAHYYQEIFADPHRFDRIYQMDVQIRYSEDGGKTFQRLPSEKKHSDNHALAFLADQPDYLLCGTDGGLYESFDRGKHWRYFSNLPLTQFYKIAVDNRRPFYHIFGGTQDNGSQWGPSRTDYRHGVVNADWKILLDADGYGCAIDPADPDILYGEWQVGRLFRIDLKSGESVVIQPRSLPGAPPLRFNWDTPFFISPHSHTRLYLGSQQVHRSDDRGQSWRVVSPDLTRNISRLQQPMMERRWSVDALWDHNAMSYYGSISALAESPLREGLLYAGSDDGLIQVSEDGGAHWRPCAPPPGLSASFYVNHIHPSPLDPGTVFVALDIHKTGDFRPCLYKSIDMGRSWLSIAGDLPTRHLVWCVAQDPQKRELLFVGTEFGVFVTLNGGKNWLRLNGGLPVIAIRDLKIQAHQDDLVVATFGRGIYILDDYSPLRQMDDTYFAAPARLAPVKTAFQYAVRTGQTEDQGSGYFSAPNPPYGAVFCYYLKETVKSERERRREQERQAGDAHKTFAIPDWKTLRLEAGQDAPVVVITISDAERRVVRRLTAPAEKGLRRVAWDLNYADMITPVRAGDYQEEDDYGPSRQIPVIPGTFYARLDLLENEELKPLAPEVSFRVESLGLNALPEAERRNLLAVQEKTSRLQRAIFGAWEALNDYIVRLRLIKKVILETPTLEPTWLTEASALIRRLEDIKVAFVGEPVPGRHDEPVITPLLYRVSLHPYTSSPQGASAMEAYESALREFSPLLKLLRRTGEEDLPGLENRLEKSGAPWTPGRKLPDWNGD